MSGQGFAFSMNGFAPLIQSGDALVQSAEVIPFAEVAVVEHATPQPQVAPRSKRSDRPLTSVDVIKCAKQRVRELRAELKRMGKLKSELAALERLLKAANEKPSNVRALQRAS